MKHSLLASLALALLAAPRLALAQTAPIVTAGTPPPIVVPTPQQLLDHLFDPYDRSFAATFDASLQDLDSPSPALKLHLKVLHRAEAAGVVEGAKMVGIVELEGQTDTLQLVDDGRDSNITFGDKTGHAEALALLPQLLSTLQKLIGEHKKLPQVADFSPVSLKLQVKATPLLLLDAKDKDGHVLHAVVDARTRALISLELSGAYSVRVSDQTFDAPIADSEFNSTQVAEFRHTNPNSITLIVPSFLSADDDNEATTKTTAPAKPTSR